MRGVVGAGVPDRVSPTADILRRCTHKSDRRKPNARRQHVALSLFRAPRTMTNALPLSAALRRSTRFLRAPAGALPKQTSAVRAAARRMSSAPLNFNDGKSVFAVRDVARRAPRLRAQTTACERRTLTSESGSRAFSPLPPSPRSCAQDVSTAQLLRSYLIFTACTVKPLVKNAGQLVKLSNRILGKTLTSAVMKVG